MVQTLESPSVQPYLWHALDAEAVIDYFQSDSTDGLMAHRIPILQQRYGLNTLTQTAGRSHWEIFTDQFKNVMLIMLMAVAIVSAGLDLKGGQFPKDAIAISAIVLLNSWLGYLQESRAEKALSALKSMSSSRVRVIRNGQELMLESQDLVPGDIMLLEAGMQIPADGRLIKTINLQIQESALTGEAEAVNKQADCLLSENAALGDRINSVYRGTEVIQGRGLVLVTTTGMETELGRIAAMIQAVETEPTPLQQRMSQLGNTLVTGSMILVALVVVGSIIRQGDFSAVDEWLEVSLSMAVAVVPEGLPAVITVTLALGTQRMIRRQALIRRLPAVETLGSVTTICSDKTGTLTQNKMIAQQIQLPSNILSVSGTGYEPIGEFLTQHGAIVPCHQPDLELLLTAGAMCNDAALQKEQGDWSIIGDPTEGSLLVLAAKAGLGAIELQNLLPRVQEVPFSSERKRMSVLCRASQADYPLITTPYILFVKGSPEQLLSRCNGLQFETQSELLTPQHRDQIVAQNATMATQGLRVLGLAYRPISELPPVDRLESYEQNLTWLGLVGIMDAPRAEAKVAVQQCRQAGIRPIMITGDHPLTAMAIAQHTGIAQADDPIMTGKDLEELSSDELAHQVNHVSVYARVAPEHKLKIVQALQKNNAFVAMTGDGVNDAPALKQSDIGIAMGITGTDVSQEASDMVLLDDNFATIVAATEEGRILYSNIRRFIKYILGSNIGEVITVAAAPLLGLGGVPLSPLQILWMNLVTDGLPALALAMEPGEAGVMNRPPHNPRESIFARGLGLYIIRIGLILSVLTIALMAWSYQYTTDPSYSGNPDTWKTMVFTTLCLAQMGHALAVRSDTQLSINLNPWSNPYLLGAVSITTMLQLGLLYIPFSQSFFGVQPLNATELLICLGFSALMFVWIEAEKLLSIWWQRRTHSPVQVAMPR